MSQSKTSRQNCAILINNFSRISFTAFKKNTVLEPIEIVDIYQVLAAALGIEARPHNGTWNNVKDAFVAGTSSAPGAPLLGMLMLPLLSLAAVGAGCYGG